MSDKQPSLSERQSGPRVMQTPIDLVVELLVMAKIQGRRKESNEFIEQALDISRILAADYPSTDQREAMDATLASNADVIDRLTAKCADLQAKLNQQADVTEQAFVAMNRNADLGQAAEAEVAALKAQEPVALKVGDVGYVRVRVDTPPNAGWCFVSPESHPADVARGRVTEWNDQSQFFGGLASPVPPAPAQEAQVVLCSLESALNAMLTFFGMDEDDASKPTFDKARGALALAEVKTRELVPWERASLDEFRRVIHGWHEKACAKGYDGVAAMCDLAAPAQKEPGLTDRQRIDFISDEWFYTDGAGNVSFCFSEIWDAGKHKDLRAAIDAHILAAAQKEASNG